ncbi:hypothetical protein P153DRAFT_326536 [Dothidotthia symphoricarpi CBS 119687]|uniref:Jacalin-type lectin domain-containing protein n=1 Tax=Dothidotthia symphoricarpi CBS 119687 TaxID=1392245 RepID=A0A6A6A0A0_9PLEO|nr:uncharacterized protein P153DRAFT_326536 [Dothidotthia symphoricarpi CBS 119687]KAF2124387.1 hypothetical protein P153DRAFT_326536 [Dothidotthia symphoricarpi CBS 119687]
MKMVRNAETIRVTNVEDGEMVHQRCLLVIGEYQHIDEGEHYLSVKTTGANNIEAFPEQTWPIAAGNFKALVMLSPGLNKLELTHLRNDNLEATVNINVMYIPLLQNPPLHLAIMVAKDSPLLIDCPPHKARGISSAHSDLDAAVAKLRMTAYMWQAMTAEDLRSKGLGRRAFRFDEEWAQDTVSQVFSNAKHDESLDREGAMRSTAKVHIIRSEKTIKEIRNARVAQQNPNAGRKNGLFKYFMNALNEAGGPFETSARPVVAGLILDSHYSMSQNMILGHAALGCHNPEGISLGMFGSHLTYSWPRFMEEVTSCLTDAREPGNKVGNDNSECHTMWEACTVGQGAHLHEVGHAFGSPHRPGIMERGYAQDWPKNFVTKTGYCGHLKVQGVTVCEDTPNNARWNLVDALAFRLLPHFHLPTDPVMTVEERKATPTAEAENESGDEDELNTILAISSLGGIARVSFNDREEAKPTSIAPIAKLRYTRGQLEKRFDRTEPLHLKIVGFNGRETTVKDVWKLLAIKSFVRIPGSSIRLSKRSVQASELRDDDRTTEWAQLLREKGPDGKIHRATSIDLRVGCIWDGGVVKYADGHVSHWGPMYSYNSIHRFGGHASEKIDLPPNVDIEYIEVHGGCDWGSDVLCGVRVHLADGTARGELNAHGEPSDVVRLEPKAGEVVVGFYGVSGGSFYGVREFGILTAPREVGITGLPEQAFELAELRNTAAVTEGDADEYHEEDEDEDDGEEDEEDEDE